VTNDKIIREAVKKAQEEAMSQGLKIGTTAAHPSDKMTYELLAVEGTIAIVGLSAEQSKAGQEVRKQFPLNELFDPNVALKYACLIKAGLN